MDSTHAVKAERPTMCERFRISNKLELRAHFAKAARTGVSGLGPLVGGASSEARFAYLFCRMLARARGAHVYRSNSRS